MHAIRPTTARRWRCCRFKLAFLHFTRLGKHQSSTFAPPLESATVISRAYARLCSSPNFIDGRSCSYVSVSTASPQEAELGIFYRERTFFRYIEDGAAEDLRRASRLLARYPELRAAANDAGETAFEVAVRNNNTAALCVLKKFGGLEATSAALLTLAARWRSAEALSFLLGKRSWTFSALRAARTAAGNAAVRRRLTRALLCKLLPFGCFN